MKRRRKGKKQFVFVTLLSLMFLSVSGGGGGDISETQEIIIEESTSYSMEKEEQRQVITIEVDPADMTVYELQTQNGRIAEQIEKVDEIDKELEGIIEQLKKED